MTKLKVVSSKDNLLFGLCLCGKVVFAHVDNVPDGCRCKLKSELPRKHYKLYEIWKGFRQRCNNPKHQRYHRYGGRGIGYVSEWDNFTVFCEWALDNGYVEGISLDHKDNDKGYFPANCRWVTLSVNTQNKYILCNCFT